MLVLPPGSGAVLAARCATTRGSIYKEWRTEMRDGYVPEPSGPVITPRLWSQAERDTPMGEWGKP